MANFRRCLHRAFIRGGKIILCLSTAVNLLAQDSSVSLSLEDAFRRVREQNLDIRIGEAGIEVSKALTRQARADLLPQLNLQASQNRQQFGTVGGFFSGLQDVGESTEQPRPFITNSFSASINASIALIDPTTIASYRAAKLDELAAELQQISLIEDVYARVAQLYFLHLRNLSALSVAQANTRRDEVLLELAVQRRESGVANNLDVTRARAAVARDRQDELVQRSLVRESRIALLQALDMDPTSDVQLADEPLTEPRLAGLPELRSLVESRPEYKAALEILRRNRVAESAAQWQRFPSVSLLAQYGYGSEVIFDDNEQEQWLIGVSLNMPIWEGGRILAERAQARALVRQQLLVIEQLEREIQNKYLLAQEAVQERWEELPLAREAVELSEQELEFARSRFESGVADNSDVIQAQTALAASNDLWVDAVYRYHLARIELARVLGKVEENLTR